MVKDLWVGRWVGSRGWVGGKYTGKTDCTLQES